jgi:molybdopterin molybdotransferase
VAADDTQRPNAHRPTVEQHAEHVRQLVGDRLRGVERVPLAAALGRATASAVLSPVDLPLFRNSQMDGFAVRAADAPGRLPIVAEVPAGPGSPDALIAGTAVRIMTGAVVPEGADAVVPVEHTTETDGMVAIDGATEVGTYVRDRGSDLHAGDPILDAGTVLGSRHIAALAAAGIRELDVRSRPRVALITTGAELADDPTLPGQIHDANLPALVAAVTVAGGLVHSAQRVTDDVAAMLAALEATVGADIVVTSGGISQGDYEVVREALEPRGARVTTIAMQPGGPQATALVGGVPVLCFPGNPVSTQVSFEVFLAPLLREAAGLPPARREVRTLAHGIPSTAGKRRFLRGRFVGQTHVELASGPGSHLVAGLAAADCLLDIPAEVEDLEVGASVETLTL